MVSHYLYDFTLLFIIYMCVYVCVCVCVCVCVSNQTVMLLVGKYEALFTWVGGQKTIPSLECFILSSRVMVLKNLLNIILV
jgi:hypothetical protein